MASEGPSIKIKFNKEPAPAEEANQQEESAASGPEKASDEANQQGGSSAGGPSMEKASDEANEQAESSAGGQQIATASAEAEGEKASGEADQQAEGRRHRSRSARSRSRNRSEKGSGAKEGAAPLVRREPDNRPKPKADPRSRRMLGGLLGHLTSARSRLETERGLASTEKREKQQQSVEEKIQQNRESWQEQRKLQIEGFQKDKAEKAKEYEQKDLKILQGRLENHYSRQMKFIQTKAEPQLLYLPFKHNKATDGMVEENRSRLKKKSAALKAQIRPDVLDAKLRKQLMHLRPDKAIAALELALATQDPEEAARANSAAAVLSAVGDTEDRSKKKCKTDGCNFLVHSDPNVSEDYCCKACMNWRGHGKFCEQIEVPKQSEKMSEDKNEKKDEDGKSTKGEENAQGDEKQKDDDEKSEKSNAKEANDNEKSDKEDKSDEDGSSPAKKRKTSPTKEADEGAAGDDAKKSPTKAVESSASEAESIPGQS